MSHGRRGQHASPTLAISSIVEGMGRKRPVSILRREQAIQPAAKKQRKAKQPQPQQLPRSEGAPKPPKHKHANSTLQPTSAVHRQAASAIRRLLAADASQREGATLKSLTLAPHVVAKKATYAVTCEALKHLPVLQQLLDRTQLLGRSPGLDREVALVLVYEALFGERFRGTGPAERAVLAQKDALSAELQQLLEEAGAASVQGLLPAVAGEAVAAARPRAVRVNTLKMSAAEALAWLRSPPAGQQQKKWEGLGQQVEMDQLLPDLLLLPPGTSLHDHPLVADGRLILQSKASCMPAHALAPQPGWHVVDACAAPGNKTTHLAALMSNRGRVSAFDKDPRRLARLQRNADLAGASCIAAAHADFLSLDPEAPEFADVRGLLLDPSCSGSGTTLSRMDFLLPSAAGRPVAGAAALEHCDERVEALAQFQEAALCHALRFPALQRLVYSTCSLHLRENEGVVAAVLDKAQEAGFKLVDPFPSWHRRGVPGSVKGAEKLVRTDPEEDGTDGFFVAVFERKQTAPAPKPAAAAGRKAAAARPMAAAAAAAGGKKGAAGRTLGSNGAAAKAKKKWTK